MLKVTEHNQLFISFLICDQFEPFWLIKEERNSISNILKITVKAKHPYSGDSLHTTQDTACLLKIGTGHCAF